MMKPIEPILGPKELEEVVDRSSMPKLAFVRDDGSFEDPNWLNTLPIHTVFLSKEKRTEQGLPNTAAELLEYHVIHRHGKTTRLMLILPNHPPIKRWVDTMAFSLKNTRVETLYEGQQYHRPIQSERLDDVS